MGTGKSEVSVKQAFQVFHSSSAIGKYMNELNRNPFAFNDHPVQGFALSFCGKCSAGYFFFNLDTRQAIIKFKEMPEYSASQGNTEIRESLCSYGPSFPDARISDRIFPCCSYPEFRRKIIRHTSRKQFRSIIKPEPAFLLKRFCIDSFSLRLILCKDKAFIIILSAA